MTRAAECTHTEQDLIASARSGSRSAFGELVVKHWEGTVNVVYRLTGESELAEEAAQEAFIRGWQRLRSFQQGKPFRNWIYRIAVNAALDALRKRHPEVDLDSVSLVSPADSPEEAAVRGELSERVIKAVLGLPFSSRAVLILREYEGMSYQEIASTLGIPVGTVMSRLNYARSSLRRMLAKEMEA